MVLNFLPGPVSIHPSVRRAFAQPAISHRGRGFVTDVQELRQRLGRLVGACQVELLLGSGTLANDAVAAQLSLRRDAGLILVNGEFGERLVDHAQRFGLRFEVFTAGWGQGFAYDALELRLAHGAQPAWLWATHCETSTGVLNDLEALKDLCRRHGVDLILDCISSVGLEPVDLSGVHLATATSGKGLASYAGIAMIFHDHDIPPSPAVPRYLDLGTYAEHQSLPYTTSSNLIHALSRSLERLEEQGAARARHRRELSQRLHRGLVSAGWRILAPTEIAAPSVLTLVPQEVSAFKLGECLEREGFLLSYRSGYLVRRNLIQICLMGEHDAGGVEALLERLCQPEKIWARA